MQSIAGLYEQLRTKTGESATPIAREEGEFLFEFVRRHQLSRTLEVGFAYGFSAAYIVSATRSPHYAIDPYQDNYDNLGFANLERLGLSPFLRLERDLAHNVLPKLYASGVRLDFAFIDGDHKFDTTFVEFYYLDLMLQPGGYVMLHDAWMPSIQWVRSWICANKSNYRAVDIAPANMLAFQKLGEDVRPWTHFAPFAVQSSRVARVASAVKSRIGRLRASPPTR